MLLLGSRGAGILFVSICIIAHNEEDKLNDLFEDIKKQDYQHALIEIVLVDSASTDNTLSVMRRFSEEYNGFKQVQILDNPKKGQAAGWNIALKRALGQIIIRIDAHASVPRDFVRKNVKCILEGEDICGGRRPNIIDEFTPWKETLLLAESSMFGSSIAPYRRKNEKKYVKSMFHAAYKREVFEKVGGFNELLGRTEDNELHYRMRKAGYKLCFNSDIVSYQHTRNSLARLIKQKYGNGFWIGLTLGYSPRCLSLFHFVPFLFVIAIVLSLLLSVFNIILPVLLLGVIYGIVSIIMAMLAVSGEKKYIQQLLLPLIFFLLHISYGLGTLIGIAKLPKWRYQLDSRENGVNTVKDAMIHQG